MKTIKILAVVASVMLSATASLAEVTSEMKVDKHTVAYLRTRINTFYHSKNVDRDDAYCTTRYKKVFKTASDFADELEKKIDEICKAPKTGRLVENEYLKRNDVRRILVGNYIVYYIISL